MSFVLNAYISLLYKEINNVEDSEFYANKAIEIAQHINNKICCGHIYWSNLELFYNNNTYDKARLAGIKAIEIFESCNQIYEDLPDLYILVGDTCLREKLDKEALEYYKQAFILMKKIGGYSEQNISQILEIINRLKLNN